MDRKRLFRALVVLLVILLFISFLAMSSTAGTWRDDFEAGNLNGWEFMTKEDFTICRIQNPAGFGVVLEKEAWFVEDGILHGRNLKGVDGIWGGDVSWRDYKLGVDVMFLEQNPGAGFGICAGIYLRGIDCNKVYGFGMCTTSPRLVILAHPEAADWSINIFIPPVQMNKWYKLEMEAKESHFRVYFDGQEMVKFDDKSFENGKIALTIAYVHALFDNVEVTGPNISSRKALSPHDKLTTIWARIKTEGGKVK